MTIIMRATFFFPVKMREVKQRESHNQCHLLRFLPQIYRFNEIYYKYYIPNCEGFFFCVVCTFPLINIFDNKLYLL
jgi:hypothetical protein